MKPEAWYDADRAFAIHPEATAIMDFAQANEPRACYGHTLVWHSQTPAWFFTRDDGHAADEQRRRPAGPPRPPALAHLLRSPEALSTAYGPVRQRDESAGRLRRRQRGRVGCEHRSDGLRRSRWYDVLGESYIDLAFGYADEAFNETYAVTGPDSPGPAGDQRLQHRAGRQAAAPARARQPPARTRRAGGCGRPPVPPQPLDADPVAGGRDRRVRRPAGDAGRERARRDDGHAGDRSASDRPGLLLPRRLPGASASTRTSSSR